VFEHLPILQFVILIGQAVEANATEGRRVRLVAGLTRSHWTNPSKYKNLFRPDLGPAIVKRQVSRNK
jgi:hypothetical protein